MVSVNLSAYLDQELDPEQAELITSHLNQCVDCAALKEGMEEMDETLQREWRDSAPLPSSSQFHNAIDSIMDALPAPPAAAPKFAPRRMHARTRWMRFATGMSGMIVFGGLLWSSYQLGYTQGRRSSYRTAFGASGEPSLAGVPGDSSVSLRAFAPSSPSLLPLAKERRLPR